VLGVLEGKKGMEMTKRCSKCKEVKDKSDFYKNRSKSDGLSTECKVCIKIAGKTRYQKNWKAILEAQKTYYDKNRQTKLTYQKAYYQENRESILEYCKIYRKGYVDKNRGKINAKTARRRAGKRKAYPDWLTQEHHSAIAELYSAAQKLTKETGIPHHVDHIVPLKGKSYDLSTKRMRHTISGLHVPWNLQVVSEEENLSKGCRYSEWK
jgi:hypothetical protein